MKAKPFGHQDVADRPKSTDCKLSSVLRLFAIGVCVLLGCGQQSAMIEYPPLIDLPDSNFRDHVPIIFAGTALTTPTPVGDPRHSRFDGILMQPFLWKVHVENVLKGNISAGETVDLNFFMSVESLGGRPQLSDVQPGQRDLFFVQRDSGKLRLICDGWRSCVPVIRSGSHPNFKADPNVPLDNQIADILLSRGVGATDDEMVRAIGETGININAQAIAEKLQHLAQTETPVVRAAACRSLKGLDHPCPEDVLKQLKYNNKP